MEQRNMKSHLLIVSLSLFALSLLSPESVAQGFTAAQKEVYDEIIQAQEMDDFRAVEKLARKNKTEMEGIYEVLESRMIYNDSIDGWEELKVLGRALDGAQGGNVWAKRMDIVSKMTLDQRKERADSRSQYAGLRAAIQSAVKNREKEALQESCSQMIELAGKFAALGDPVYQSYCLSVVASAMADTDRELEAVKLYDQIDKALTNAGFQQFTFHGQVKAVLTSLKNQGYDPNAKPGESSAPKGNSSKSWAEDAEGQRWSDPIQLKLVVEPKLPWKYITPSARASENTAKWPFFVLSGNGPASFSSHFTPLGTKFKVSRAGVKAFYHLADQKPKEFKCISKANLVEMKRDVTTISGDTIRQKYAWLAATGGSQESRFGLSLNASPQTGSMMIRYQPACYLKGKVLGQSVMILDDNASGVFGDAQGLRDSTSALQPEFNWTDAMIVGKSKTADPFTEFIEADGSFYRMKLSADDYSVRTRKLAIDSGKVKLKFFGKVKPQIVIIEERREFKGAFFAINEKSYTTVPVGSYRVSFGIIRKGKKAAEQSCTILPGNSRAFRVEKDEEVVVELGSPFEFDFKHEQGAGGAVKVIGNTVVVYGRAGELYHRFWDQPPTPEKVSIRVKGGGSGGKPQSMGTASFEDYQQNQLTVWSPLDLVFPGKPENNYEIKMELKKHSLLGGPIKSDWK